MRPVVVNVNDNKTSRPAPARPDSSGGYLRPGGVAWAEAEQASVDYCLSFMEKVFDLDDTSTIPYPGGSSLGINTCHSKHIVTLPTITDSVTGVKYAGIVVEPTGQNQCRVINAVASGVITWATATHDPNWSALSGLAAEYNCLGLSMKVDTVGAEATLGSKVYMGQAPYNTSPTTFSPETAMGAFFDSEDVTADTTNVARRWNLVFVPVTFDAFMNGYANSNELDSSMFGMRNYSSGGSANDGYLYFVAQIGSGSTDTFSAQIRTRFSYLPLWTVEQAIDPQFSIACVSDLQKTWTAILNNNDVPDIDNPIKFPPYALRRIRALMGQARGGGSFWSDIVRGARKVGNSVWAEAKDIGGDALRQARSTGRDLFKNMLRKGVAAAGGALMTFAPTPAESKTELNMLHSVCLAHRLPAEHSPLYNRTLLAELKALRDGGASFLDHYIKYCLNVSKRTAEDEEKEEKDNRSFRDDASVLSMPVRRSK